jgi:hypothetical protein
MLAAPPLFRHSSTRGTSEVRAVRVGRPGPVRPRRCPARPHQAQREKARRERQAGQGDRGPHGQQGTCPLRRVDERQPLLDPRHLLLTPGRSAFPLRHSGTHLRAALQRGQAARHQGPLLDEEGRTAESTQSLTPVRPPAYAGRGLPRSEQWCGGQAGVITNRANSQARDGGTRAAGPPHAHDRSGRGTVRRRPRRLLRRPARSRR